MNPMQDHSCHWTRRRESELSRGHGRIIGAGLSHTILEAAAAHLGYELKLTASTNAGTPEDESFTIGPWRGSLHDSCFVQVEPDAQALRVAFVRASLALHSFYLGVPVNLDLADTVAGSWSDGTVLQFRSIPAEGIIQLKRFPTGTGWFARLRAPTESLATGAA